MNRQEIAVESFKNGCSCSQAVLTAYCTDYGIDKKTGLKLACPFGGGMGHTGEVCGAISGALLALGLQYGQDNPEDKPAKERAYRLVKDFTARFKELNGSVHCTELVGYDLSDDSQIEAARQAGVFQTKCSKYVGDAVQLLEELISDNT